MKVLAVGDVCAPSGCDFALKVIPKLKRDKNIDFIIVNGENSAAGNGITSASAQTLFSAGADVITGGNHTFRNKEFHEMLENNPFVLRPHNLKDENIGSGYCLFDMGRAAAAVINISGQIYLERLNADNALKCADALVERAKSDGARFIFVDFHAEATSEKRAMGFYLDGRVSAVFGTHTHVQTADEQILPCGTAYITDLGMTGPVQSVLGVTPELAIEKMRTNLPVRFQNPDGECRMQGMLVEIDKKTGKALCAERVSI